MDAETFVAERASRLADNDAELEPFVRAALTRHGDPNWADDLIEATSVLWLEVYLAEAPNANGERNLKLFQDALRESLDETSDPEAPPAESQVDTVTKWVSTFTANDATWRGVQARGGKFTRWLTSLDPDVRATHAYAHGQIRSVGGTFDIGGYDLHYPGEPVGPPEIWINCRCLIQSAARQGEAMSGTTYTIGPEDDLQDDNPDIVVGNDAFATIPDVDTEPIPEIDEDELIPDEPEDGEELITEIPVHGVLAPEGVKTGDGRMFAIGALTTRDLPIPLRYETIGTHGGQTSDVVTVGRVDEAWRDDASDMWRFKGVVVLTKPFAEDVIAGVIDGTVRGVSIDGDDAEVQVQEPEEGEEIDLLELLMPSETVFSRMRVAGLTIVPIPAFQEAYIGLGHEFQEDLTSEQQDEQLAALLACGCLHDDEFRDVDTEERKRLADKGAAMPDGSYPIANCDDLKNAIQAIGRAKDPEATKAHIRKRKSALGCDEVELPEDWSAASVTMEFDHVDPEVFALITGQSVESFAPGTHDGPGWITHPVPTQRIRNYWVHGEGAAKIKWGVGGDFNRCRKQLAKYIANPDWLAGTCANLHYEALGIWPSTHAGKGKRNEHALLASGAVVAPIARLVEPEYPIYPAEYFAEPTAGHAYPLKIDRETRRVHGYVAEWGTCHVGMAGMCQEVPPSYTNYAYFLKGVIDTTEGEQFVGCLTFGGHAGRTMSLSRASDFYDKPDAVRAFVNVGENAFGVWFAGIIPPDVTDADITKMRAIGAVSGDWREVRGNLELIGVPVVNTPGLPVRQMAASAGRQTVLIGVGALKPEPVLVASAALGLDADTVAGITRAAVAEYRHQEKLSERLEPQRQRVRQRRLEAARARVNRE